MPETQQQGHKPPPWVPGGTSVREFERGTGSDALLSLSSDADDEDQGGVAHMRALQAEGLNVVLTPHVGGVTELSRAKMSRVFVDNVVRVLGC